MITAAADGSFVFVPDRMLQQTGFAMAVAVLFDAVVIRCLVVPALMRLFGAKAWWLPPRLERWMPQLHVEGRPAEFPPPDHSPKPAADPSQV